MKPSSFRLAPPRFVRALLATLLLTACSSPDPHDSPAMGGSGGEPGGTGGSLTSGAGAASAAGINAAGSGAAGVPSGGGGALGGSGGAGGGGASTGGGNGGNAGTAPSSSIHPPAAGAGDIAAGIAQLNLYRASLGLSQVTLDEPSSIGCEGHLLYLIEEAEQRGQPGYLEHTESNRDNRHYSAENEAAGKNSDLAWGQRGGPGSAQGQSLGQAVDLWLNGVYHRRPLLDPGLVKVGAASNQGYNCLNYNASGNTTVKKPDAPVLWPAAGMTDVPRAFGGNEGPCPTNPSDPRAGGSCGPSGFIISAVWYNWGTGRMSALTSVASVTLTNSATQAEIPLLTWYADGVSGHDPAPGYMRDEIALVPEATLAANTSYEVAIDAVVSGTPTELRWSFKTGSRNQ